MKKAFEWSLADVLIVSPFVFLLTAFFYDCFPIAFSVSLFDCFPICRRGGVAYLKLIVGADGGASSAGTWG